MALSSRLMIGLMCLVALLNLTGIFKISPIPLYITVLISIVDFFLPTFFYDILKKHDKWIRYFLLAVMVIQSGLLYSVLSYHTIIMLVFPIILACLFNERIYVIYTTVLSIPMIIVSHLLAFYLGIVPDEPLVTMKGTFLYGIVPRLIEFLGISLVCFFIASNME